MGIGQFVYFAGKACSNPPVLPRAEPSAPYHRPADRASPWSGGPV